MIPQSLQGVLWSKSVAKLDTQRDKNYIIHQILAYGGWTDLGWLLRVYPKSEIITEFVNRPTKDYQPEAFNFVKNLLLGIKQPLDVRRYDRTTPRLIR